MSGFRSIWVCTDCAYASDYLHEMGELSEERREEIAQGLADLGTWVSVWIGDDGELDEKEFVLSACPCCGDRCAGKRVRVDVEVAG